MRRYKGKGMTPFAAGSIALVLIAVAVYFGFTKTNPFADPFEFSATFKSASDIKPKSPVRIAGVNVGKVTKVEPLADGEAGARVYMAIERSALPLHDDVQMKIRPRIFLEGNWFVEVEPGSPSAPALKEGALVPVQQTDTPVQFGQVLTALQSDTREDLQVVLDEYGRGLADGGADGFNRSIRHWPGAFRDSAIVNDAMRGQTERDLSGYIRESGRVAAALDADREALKDLVTNFAVTADALADEDARLRATIAELPRTLNIGREALGRLNDAFPELRAFTADLRPAVRSSGPALDATGPLVRELRGLMQEAELKGLVRDLRPLVPELVELNEGGVALQKELRLLSSCTNEVISPWRNDRVKDPVFAPSGPVYQEQVKWLPGIAAESRSFDANGQYVRTLGTGTSWAYPVADNRFFLTGLPLQGVNPPKQKKTPFMPDVPCETQQKPDLESLPAPAPPGREVDRSSAEYRERTARERAEAVRFLREDLERLGLGRSHKVLDEPLTDLSQIKPIGGRR